MAAAAGAITAAGAVLVQLQQPAAAALAAARLAHDAGRLVVLDGVPGEPHRNALLAVYGVDDGNLFVWNGPRWGRGRLLLPLTDDPVVDTTGAGDALVAALTVALLRVTRRSTRPGTRSPPPVPR